MGNFGQSFSYCSLPHSNPWFLRQAWFRNTWSWNHSKRPSMTYVADERRIEIVSHLSCLMYFDVVFALNNQRYLMCKIHFDPWNRCDFVMFYAHFRWATRAVVHCLGPGTRNSALTISMWKRIQRLLELELFHSWVQDNTKLYKIYQLNNWYHHSEWLAFRVGFCISILRGDLLWEWYAWRPRRWGCLEPLQGDLLWRDVFFFPMKFQSGSFARNQSQRCRSRCPYSAIYPWYPSMVHLRKTSIPRTCEILWDMKITLNYFFWFCWLFHFLFRFFQVKCGDFRSLEPAAWHDIHSRFGTHLGPKPGVETLDVRCHVMATCQKLRIYKFSFDFVANCCGERWYTVHDKRIILEISYRGMCVDAEAQETGKDQGFRYHLSGRNTGCFKDRSSHYEVIVF